MSSILGLGNRAVNLNQLRNQEAKKGEKFEKIKERTSNYDTYTPSTMAISETAVETEEETLFDYMGEEGDTTSVELDMEDSDIDVEDSDIEVEDSDIEVEDSDIEVEDGDIEVEDGDIEAEDGDIEEEDLDLENNMSATAPTRVNGYVSSLTEEDRAMLATAYQGFQALKLEGTSLFDYLDDTSGWFESSASAPTTYDTSAWDLSSFEEFLANLGTSTEESEEVKDSSTSTEQADSDEIVEDNVE